MTAALATDPTRSIEERERAALAKEAQLGAKLEQLKLDAEKASRACKANGRQPADLLEAQCAALRVQDAQEELEAELLTSVQLKADADLARRTSRFEMLLGQLGKPVTSHVSYGQLLDTVANTRRDLLGKSQAFREEVARRNALVAEATALAGSLGRSEYFSPLDLQELLSSIATTVVPPAQTMTPDTLTFSIFTMSGGRDTERLKFEINLSTKGEQK